MDAELLRSKGASPQNIRRAGVPDFALRIGKQATLSGAVDGDHDTDEDTHRVTGPEELPTARSCRSPG
jgi:hypothetical protein